MGGELVEAHLRSGDETAFVLTNLQLEARREYAVFYDLIHGFRF
jgi:hypothetical protein